MFLGLIETQISFLLTNGLRKMSESPCILCLHSYSQDDKRGNPVKSSLWTRIVTYVFLAFYLFFRFAMEIVRAKNLPKLHFYFSLEIMMNMKFLRKGFALFAGLMLLSNVFLPSAVVFAEDGTPLAATEQVNQVAQSEATASVEENSTLEVSPEKVASESSEALAPETPKAEEVNENSAETTVQEAKEEQKAEPASELIASAEAEKTESAPKAEEGRAETLTPAQQGGGDAGSSDSVVATPEDKQSIEEKKEAKKDRPSMIADRSDEGQPFVMEETTFRGKKALEDVVYFYSSSNTRKVAGILKKVGDYEVIDREATVQLAEKLGFSKEDVEAKLLLFSNDRIVEIDGKKVFFALEKKNAKKQKVTYVSEHNSNLKDAFK